MVWIDSAMRIFCTVLLTMAILYCIKELVEMIGIAGVCVLTLIFLALAFVENKVMSKFSKRRNHIKFYVARDMNGTIWLYMCKPKRAAGSFVSSEHGLTLPSGDFSKYGLDENDYVNLKWEDEPVEVFVNMED